MKGESDPFYLNFETNKIDIGRTFSHTCHFDKKDGVYLKKTAFIGIKMFDENGTESSVGE